MVDSLRLYARYLGISIRGQMQYRASFVLAALGQFCATGIEFLGLWALFHRFERLGEWTLAEVALFYGVVNVGFSFADALSKGFDLFGDVIRSGEFDRMLLRPRSPILQLAGQELALRRVGRLLQGGAILLWAAAQLGVAWSLGQLGLLLFAIAGVATLFFGLFVLQATLCFWTTETLELMNTMTYGGVEASQYPLVIYARWFQRFFTFVVPLACVAYFPVVALLGREDPLGTPVWFQQLAPLMGAVFLGVALVAFRLGTRRYTSTGS